MTSTFRWFVLVVDGDDVWLHLNSSVLTIQTVHIYTNRVRDSILHNFWHLGNGKVDYYETVQYCLHRLFLVQVFGCHCNVYVLAFSGHTRTELQLNIALHINCIK